MRRVASSWRASASARAWSARTRSCWYATRAARSWSTTSLARLALRSSKRLLLGRVGGVVGFEPVEQVVAWGIDVRIHRELTHARFEVLQLGLLRIGRRLRVGGFLHGLGGGAFGIGLQRLLEAQVVLDVTRRLLERGVVGLECVDLQSDLRPLAAHLLALGAGIVARLCLHTSATDGAETGGDEGRDDERAEPPAPAPTPSDHRPPPLERDARKGGIPARRDEEPPARPRLRTA